MKCFNFNTNAIPLKYLIKKYNGVYKLHLYIHSYVWVKNNGAQVKFRTKSQKHPDFNVYSHVLPNLYTSISLCLNCRRDAFFLITVPLMLSELWDKQLPFAATTSAASPCWTLTFCLTSLDCPRQISTPLLSTSGGRTCCCRIFFLKCLALPKPFRAVTAFVLSSAIVVRLFLTFSHSARLPGRHDACVFDLLLFGTCFQNIVGFRASIFASQLVDVAARENIGVIA